MEYDSFDSELVKTARHYLETIKQDLKVESMADWYTDKNNLGMLKDTQTGMILMVVTIEKE